MDFSGATGFLEQFGVWGLALTLVVNCMGIPIASEVTLPVAGVLIKRGTFDLTTVLTLTMTAQLVGLSLSYAVARRGGVALLERYGRYVFLGKASLRRLQRLFDRHGALLVLLGACIPGLHGYVGYPAGLARMSFVLFLFMATLGVAVWTVAFVGLGALLANHLDIIGAASSGFGAVTMVGLLLIMAAIWYHRHHARTGK